MIGKAIGRRNGQPGSFGGLVNYITQGRDGVERVADIRITNCDSLSVDWAIREVHATQGMNKRCGSDRTYHLLLSFRPGEEPSKEVLAQIEESMVQALGFGEHQRVSAVHQDTDHLHIHIAINKIHPTKGTIHTPLRDFKTIGETCAALEAQFGLAVTNHERKQSVAAGRAADMEQIGLRESLQGFVRRELADGLRVATDWTQVHQLLSKQGVELKQRGAGLVFVSIATGDGVRASTVGREFAISAMEKRLGAFERAPARTPVGAAAGATRRAQHYGKGPVGGGAQRAQLFAQYQAVRATQKAVREPRLAAIRQQRQADIERAKAQAARKRAMVRSIRGEQFAKRLMYRQISGGLRDEIQSIQKRYQTQRATIYQFAGHQSWPDWLKRQALGGDAQALEALRRRRSAQNVGNSLAGAEVGDAAPPRPATHVNTSGTVWRAIGGTLVRDDGRRLHVRESSDDPALNATITAAVRQYGHKLDVQGSNAFRQRVAELASDINPRIRFADPALEAIRKQGTAHDAKGRSRFGFGQSLGGFGDGRTRGVASDGSPDRRRAGTSAASEHGSIPLGARLQAEAENRLRGLRSFGLVHLAKFAQVLLPSDAHRNVVDGSTAPTDGVRRPDAPTTGVKRPRSRGL